MEKFCKYCGAKNSDGAAYCKSCGKQIEFPEEQEIKPNVQDRIIKSQGDENHDLSIMFKRYLKKANEGNAYAMMYIAESYLYGWGIDVDDEKYRLYLNKAAELGVSRAYERLFYEELSKENYHGVDRILSQWKNKRKLSDYEFNARYSDTYEMYSSLDEKNILGMMDAISKQKFQIDWAETTAMLYKFGYGVKKDPKRAQEILIKEMGDHIRLYELASIIGMKDIGELSISEINENIINMIKDNDIIAMKADFDGDELGYSERILVFSAYQGIKKDMIQMSLMYEDRENCGANDEYKDVLEASRWLIKFFEKCDDRDRTDDVTTAEARLILYAEELDKMKEYDIAFKAWSIIYRRGVYFGARILGNYYWNGKGVEVNYDTAVELWKIGAERGDEDAIELINSLIDMGNGDLNRGIQAAIRRSKEESISNTDPYIDSTNTSDNKSSEGCYIATCVYGSYESPEVWVLRKYRDEYLSKRKIGRMFIKIYYLISPTIVRIFGQNRFIRRVWKTVLDKIVSNLKDNSHSIQMKYAVII